MLALLSNLWKFIVDPKNTAYVVFVMPFFVFYVVKVLGYFRRVVKTGKWRVKRIKIAGQEVEFAPNEKAPTEKASREATCMECESMIIQALPILLAELRLKDHAILRAEYQIETYETLRRQMAVVENAGSKIMTLLTKRFFSLMSDSRDSGGKLDDVEDLNQHGDYTFYILVIKSIFSTVTDKFRGWFRENGMEDIPEGDFMRLYAEPRIDLLLQGAADELNAVWHGKFIERAGLYEANREIFPEIRSIAHDVFSQARQIAKEAKAEVERLEKEYRAAVDTLLQKFITRYTHLCDEDREALLSTAKDVVKDSRRGD